MKKLKSIKKYYMNSMYKEEGGVMQKYIIFILIGLIVIFGIYIVLNIEIETEYVPEIEVEESELRNTIITLYYKDKESGELTKENKLIDSKELLKNPYKVLIKMLMLGPENEQNESIIPKNVQLLDISFEKGIVFINFNKDFSEGIELERLKLCKESIYLTLSSLAEVNDIKILVEGVEMEI